MTADSVIAFTIFGFNVADPTDRAALFHSGMWEVASYIPRFPSDFTIQEHPTEFKILTLFLYSECNSSKLVLSSWRIGSHISRFNPKRSSYAGKPILQMKVSE
jgi:hypothetical protein